MRCIEEKMNMRNNALDTSELEKKAIQIRKQLCVLANEIGVIHIGGMLSAVDVVVALYYKYLNYDINDLMSDNRDRFLLSKGHCAILLYLVFCDLGVYSWEDVFESYHELGHIYGQHPNRKNNKGIEASTGSLGHGLPLSVGMSLANRAKRISSRVYCLVGDGEMQEGSNWEAIMYAGSHKLSNLVCIVDFNKSTSCFKYGDNIVLDWKKAFEAFGWNVHIITGSSMKEVVDVMDTLPGVDYDYNQPPIAIISETQKGQNVDFMQGPAWHYGSLDSIHLQEALESIERYARSEASENGR